MGTKLLNLNPKPRKVVVLTLGKLGVGVDLQLGMGKDLPTMTKAGAGRKRESIESGTGTKPLVPEITTMIGKEEEALHLTEETKIDMRKGTVAPAMRKRRKEEEEEEEEEEAEATAEGGIDMEEETIALDRTMTWEEEEVGDTVAQRTETERDTLAMANENTAQGP